MLGLQGCEVGQWGSMVALTVALDTTFGVKVGKKGEGS